MSQKIKLLFVNESLALAGGERSLIALLSNLDRDIYDIDLQLFHYGGALDDFIPSYVNILQPIPYTNFASNSLIHNLKSILRKNHFKFLRSKIAYSLRLRFGKYNHPEKAQIYWETVGESIQISYKTYDVAIAYAQGVPTFYVMDKVKAKKKITWLNGKPNFSLKNKLFQRKYYERYDAIVPVSDITSNQLKEEFPDLKNKLHVLNDIVDYKSILKMAGFKSVDFKADVFNILTVARLNYKSKRYDITLKACKILTDKGIKFHWYALGEGEYRKEMERYIHENNLEQNFTLLGTTPNPYPYFKAADLYVQTSEYESYGISIAEARLLNIPVVTTSFDTVFLQMIEGKNGLVTEMKAEAVADAIIKIMNNKELYNSIVEYLKQETKENIETVKRFDTIISNLLTTH